MRAMHAVMSTHTPMAARSPEWRRLTRPVRAETAAATAPQMASANAATVAPYPSSGIIGMVFRPNRPRCSVASSGRWPSSGMVFRPNRPRCSVASSGRWPSSGMVFRPDRPRCSVASSGRWPSSRALLAQALQQILVPRIGAVVRRLVLLGVLGEDQRGLEVAVSGPRPFDDRAASLGEQVRRCPLVPAGDARLAVREREGEIQGPGLPLERARLNEPPQAVGLARDGSGQELARRDEVDDALAHARPDEVGDGGDDDEAAGDELAAPTHALLRALRAARLFARPARRRQYASSTPAARP